MKILRITAVYSITDTIMQGRASPSSKQKKRIYFWISMLLIYVELSAVVTDTKPNTRNI